jgi:CheY-like chemotaxis protein
LDEPCREHYSYGVSHRCLCVLVDDDPDFLWFTRQMIARTFPQCAIEEFGNGLDALEYLARHVVDLIVTDYRMPFMDGLRLTKSVRSFDLRVPIVVISGDSVEAEAMARGATAFVSKRDILQRLAAVLQQLGALGAPAR